MAFGKNIIPVLGLLGALLLTPCSARASGYGTRPGKIILETIGIGLAVGTVLGASTLPFYDQPGGHTRNLLWGALGGAAMGFGVGVYSWLAGTSGEDEFASFGGTQEKREQTLSFDGRPSGYRKGEFQLNNRRKFGESKNRPSATRLALAPIPSPSVQFWMPLVSLSW